MLQVLLPVRTVSEANRASHEHWRVRHKRAKGQRMAAALAVQARISSRRLSLHSLLPAVVTLTRIAPRQLDDDNLAGSQKHIRDGVADALGIDDRDPRVRWTYGQRKGEPKTYGVEVTIQPLALG